MEWKQEIKNIVWKEIVKGKIRQQAYVLSKKCIDDSKVLLEFANQVVDGDTTNREGHAAKYYFNRIFGEGFSRNSSDVKNAYLNYGYSLILCQFNRYIVSKGYLTQLGIHHKNATNQFNLSCDLMEPFRPIIDNKVLKINEKDFKKDLVNLLTENVVIGGQNQTLSNAINIYCSSVFLALSTGKIEQIKFIEKYE